MKFILVVAVLLVLLTIRFFLFYHNQPQYRDGEKVEFVTTVLSEPRVSGKYQHVTARLPNSETVFIVTSRFPEFYYGQKLLITGTINKRVLGNKNQPIENRNGRHNKREAKTDNKVILTMSFPKIEAAKNNTNFRFTPRSFSEVGLALTSSIRQNVVSLYQKTLPPLAASLLSGIVLGVKTNMPEPFTQDLRAVGVMHVVAASGMNVAMVGGLLFSVFSPFLRRQIAALACIFGIFFYAVLAGFEPSILRASIMGALSFTAQALGRQYLALFALFFTGFIMLFVSPILLFDVGFQLSFLATLGLIVLPKIGVIRRIRVVGDDINTTIAAQLATLPILLTTFGSFSLWSVVVNGLVLWTIPALMVMGGVGALVGMISPFIGQAIVYLCLPFLLYFSYTVSFFARLGAIVELKDFPWQLTVGYYAVLIAIIIFYRSKGKAT